MSVVISTSHFQPGGRLDFRTEVSKSFVNINFNAYLRMLFHSLLYANSKDKNQWIEVIGWLTGTITSNSSGDSIYIDKIWPIGHGDAVSVKMENYGKKLTRVLNKKKEKSEILGWYHSHPSYGLFMSQTDFDTQSSYQRLFQKAIAIVIDPTLISSVHPGIEIYRLISPNFKKFESIKFNLGTQAKYVNFPILLNHLNEKAIHFSKQAIFELN